GRGEAGVAGAWWRRTERPRRRRRANASWPHPLPYISVPWHPPSGSDERTLDAGPAHVSDRASQSTGRASQPAAGRGMSKQTTAAVWVKGAVEMLAAEGLDVAELLSAAGIDPAALEAPAGRVETEKISRLWELAAERSGNPAIGIAQAHVVRAASFDVVGYAMMSCADLRTAFERLIRYLLILSDTFTMTMSEERGDYRIVFVLFGGNHPVP